jgi:hypothetical protein
MERSHTHAPYRRSDIHIGHSIMQRFWISLSVALAIAVPPAYAGKLGSVEQAAKTYIAKKEVTGGGSRGIASAGHGKASTIMGKGKKLLGK